MSNEKTEIPADWDAISERDIAPGFEPDSAPDSDGEGPIPPPLITLMAASWADLVAILGVCTAALLAILVLGEKPALPAFSWAAVLAVAWWVFAAAILVVIRHATPGMLLAGLRFTEAVKPERVHWVLAAALAGIVTFGLAGLLQGDHSLLRWAAASDLELVDEAA